MKLLFEIDLHDYNEGDKVSRRPSARGVIISNRRLALVYSTKEKYYKFPGGGIHDDEDKRSALIREVREEVGLDVIPESISEFGRVIRRQKSNVCPDTVFEQENFYYFCNTEDIPGEQKLDDYETEAGFVLRYADIDEAIAVNEKYRSDDYFDEIMIKREKMVLELIREYLNEGC